MSLNRYMFFNLIKKHINKGDLFNIVNKKKKKKKKKATTNIFSHKYTIDFQYSSFLLCACHVVTSIVFVWNNKSRHYFTSYHTNSYWSTFTSCWRKLFPCLRWLDKTSDVTAYHHRVKPLLFPSCHNKLYHKLNLKIYFF